MQKNEAYKISRNQICQFGNYELKKDTGQVNNTSRKSCKENLLNKILLKIKELITTIIIMAYDATFSTLEIFTKHTKKKEI